jgi:hypothetical protein
MSRFDDGLETYSVQKTHFALKTTPENMLALEVAEEVERARGMFPAIYSPHEGLGVIREEYIEFEKEVFAYNPNKNRDTRPQMRTELIQLAAMALRTILDTIDKEKA